MSHTTITTPEPTLVTFDCELTDTFGGEPNYSWVRRATIEAPEDISDRALVRRAKAALGITGLPCTRSEWGDTIELRPHGMCLVAFITVRW